MARVIVVGAGVGGLTTAMLLARDGHDVTVLERDREEPPADAEAAWRAWDRRGVNQFRMIHFFLPRFRQLVDAELPEVAAALEAAGAIRFNPLAMIPAEMTGGFGAGDERFEALTGRRPLVESVLARVAAATPRVEIRRGVAVSALLTGTPAATGIPDVTGVRTDDGDELRADLVVDAAGRRSALPALLEAAGARPPEQDLEDCGFLYYGRHFRSADGSVPPIMSGLLSPWGSVSTLTLPADNGTWGLGIITSAKDPALRALKDTETWMRAWRSFPLVAHWVDAEPIDDDQVAVMAKIEDRHRSFVVDGIPVATGVLPVADSWACTNPSLGRGASIGLMHAIALRDLLRDDTAADRVALARRWHDVTSETVEPWYRTTLDFDRHRLAEIDAEIEGKPYDPGDPQWDITKALEAGANSDPLLLRAFLRIASVLDLPDEVLATPGVFDKVVEIGTSWRDAPVFAPTREQLLEIVAA